eukprot:5114067-Amphidinium_carterae.1
MCYGQGPKAPAIVLQKAEEMKHAEYGLTSSTPLIHCTTVYTRGQVLKFANELAQALANASYEASTSMHWSVVCMSLPPWGWFCEKRIGLWSPLLH